MRWMSAVLPMASDIARLQKAIFVHLASDSILTGLLGGAKIFDRPAESAALPYITFGITRAFNSDTASEAAQEHLFTLHTWSRKAGRREAMMILDAMRARLSSLPPVLDAMRIVTLRFQSEDITFNEQVDGFQGTLRYRALTEHETL